MDMVTGSLLFVPEMTVSSQGRKKQHYSDRTYDLPLVHGAAGGIKLSHSRRKEAWPKPITYCTSRLRIAKRGGCSYV
jgi:hypothetical protein